ncbi:hypothetical protein [Streptomyces neyagawaensis]|uniref:Uncharacterized protein n=1 Tax=Streptomyces neyagawaensis TaxID=42238 RepID=A0ABV3BB48_9ACTN
MDGLNRIDPDWTPPGWPFPWQRNHRITEHRCRQGESLTQPGDGRAHRTWLRTPATI